MGREPSLAAHERRASDFLERRAWQTARELVFMLGFDEAAARVQTAADAFAAEGDRSRVVFCGLVIHIVGLLRRDHAPNECRRSQTHEYLG